MKKLFLIFLLAAASGVSFAQTSITGREVDVRAFGAKCDGTTNDQTAIQTAITAMATAGGVVNLPDGTCIVTGLSVPGGVTLRGKGKFTTTIKSSTNAVILNLVQGSGSFAFFGPKVYDLAVDGSDSGAAQIGIQVTDATYMRDVVIEDVQITDCGSHGISFGSVFSSSFKNIYSSSHGGYPFFYNSPNMPSNYFYGLYAGDVSAAAPAGYRIKQGAFTCWSCNGVNNVPATAYWAVIGGAAGDIDGDVGPFSALAMFRDCNIEGAPTAGVLIYPGSRASFLGYTTFVGLLSSSGSWKAIQYDTDPAYVPENAGRAYIEDTVGFSNSPASYFANSQPIHSDGLPPLSVVGRGPQIAGGGAAGLINTYYNTATSRAERLPRADGYAPTIDITTSTSFTNPGGRAYRVNCASPCTLTLPSPVYYENGNEIITVMNLSATGTNVTISANGGAAVNGSSYVLNIQGASVQLFPDVTSLDWRVVGNRIGPGSTDFYPIYNSSNTITATGSLLQNFSGSVLLSAPLLFSTDNTRDIGSTSDVRPRTINVGTNVRLPDGTVSAPPLARTGDTTTGVWFDASGVNMANAGTNRIRTNASGADVFNALGLGVASSANGSVIFRNSSNANTTTLQSGAPASSISITLPATLPASAGCLQISSTGVITQTGSACGAGGGSVTWDAITNPAANQALSMGAFTTAWTWNATTGASNLFTLTDTASNTGTGYIASIGTAASSSAKPIRITAGGTTNGVEMTTAGVLAAIGSGEIRATTANPSASIGLTANNGSATTAMRSDATPALSQAIVPTWTGLHTFNPSTTPQSAILIDINTLGTPGTRDSNWLVMRGRSNDGSAHLTEWKQFVDVTANAGGSLWSLESRIDGASFATRLTVSDAGAVSAGAFSGTSFTDDGGSVVNDDINAATGFTVAGAAASGQYLRGNGTRAVFAAIASGDLPSTVVRTDQANTYSTGAQNFTSATSLTVPVSAGAAVTASGQIAYDSTANALEYGSNGTNRTVANLDEAQTFTNKTWSTSNTVSASLTWTAGVKQTFAPNGTTAGINVGSVAGDPSAPANGDLWYDSTANELTARINGANVALGAGGGAVSSVSNSDTTLTISPTTGSVVASLNLAKANTWTGLQTLTIDDATTNATSNVLDIQKSSSGTPAAGMGARIRFGLETTTTANQTAGAIDAIWNVATHASRNSYISISAQGVATTSEVARFQGVQNAVNYFELYPSVTNTAVEIAANGSDTNIDIALSPKGTGVVTIATDEVVTLNAAQILTSKTIDGANNTLSNIGNASLSNSAITIAGTSTSLGGTISRDTITGVSSNGILARTAANTLTNRTLTGTTNLITVTNGDGVSGNPTFTVGSLVVRTDQANTYTTGAQSFASATSLTLPSSAGAAPTTDGQIAYDTTLDMVVAGQSGATIQLSLYDVSGYVVSKPGASQVIVRFVAPRAFTLPTGTISDGTNAPFKAGTSATAQADFTLSKNGGAAFCTLRFAAAGTQATYQSCTATDFASGDVLTITAPASQDATLADLGVTIPGRLK